MTTSTNVSPIKAADRNPPEAAAVTHNPAPLLASIASPVEPQHDIPTTVCPVLSTILAWPRPHDSAQEKAFCEWLKSRLSADRPVTMHSEGAMSVSIPCADGKPSASMFSCHVDTVDWLKPGTPVDVRKKVLYDPNFGTIFLDKGSEGTCLGADDGAGIWIMLKMIDAAVPGTYLFHRGEERGGISAKAIASKEAPWVKQFDLAIAFDRPRNDEVITHQGGMRCASDKFADALCDQLNKRGFAYKPSTRGVYTDTKEYRRLVSECINLGVGYESQHTSAESLDFAHLSALAKACCEIDWDALPADRDHTAADPTPSYTPGYRGNFGGANGNKWSQRDIHDFDPELPIYPTGGQKASTNKTGKKSKGASKNLGSTNQPSLFKTYTRRVPDETMGEMYLREIEEYNLQELAEICVSDPDLVYQVLVTLLRQRAALQGELDMLVNLVSR